MSLVKKQMVVLLCFLLFVVFLVYANKYITQLQGPLSPAHAEAFAEYKKNFGPLMGLPGVQAGENSIKLTVNRSKGAFGLGIISSFQDPGKYLTIPAQYSKPMRVQKEGYWVEFTPAFSQKINNVTAEVLKSTIIYPGILPDVDIVQHVMPYGIKEDIVIKGKDAPTFYQWKMVMDPRLTARIEHNYVSFYKKGSLLPKETESTSAETSFSETKMFEIAPPFLMDTKGNKYFQAYTALTNNIYTLSIEKKWLEKLNSYPLVLDPTILHNSSANFATGTNNRSWDEGSGAAPLLTTSYHELAADISTVGLWHLNEASGNANDNSANANTLTPSGTTIATGKLGNARTLNGTSEYLYKDSGVSGIGGSTQMTYEAWIKRTATGNMDMIYALGNVAVYKYQNLRIQADNTIRADFGNDANNNYRVAITTATYTDTTNWHHIAATYDAGNVKIYVDGVEWAITTAGSWTGAVVTETTYLRVGNAWNGGNTGYFHGSIDEVRISNIARTPQEIRQDSQRLPYSVYTSPVVDLTQVSSWTDLTWLAKGVRTGDGETPISTTGLVAQWNFNETSGTAAVSGGSCGTTCNGTLTNFASTTSQDQAVGTGWTANNKRWGAGALMFDATNDYVVASTNALPTGAGALNDFSVEMWINPTKVTGNQVFFVQQASSPRLGDFYGYIDVTGGGTLYSCRFLGSANNGDSFAIPMTGIQPGNWHHMVFTWSGGTSGTKKIYIDGIDKAGTTANNTNCGNFGNVPNTAIGAAYTSYPTSAVIDSTRIYSRALTAAEILANYQAGNIEFQTRTSADNSTWEAWKPTSPTSGVDVQIASMDSDQANWTRNSFAATGGTITYTNGYKIHTFTSSGTFTVTSGLGTVEYLVVGGGGGGGGVNHSGGGGAGGFLTGTLSVTAQNYPITVGGGGSYVSGSAGSNGLNSIFSTITATGGGGGGTEGSGAGISGGSGGGGNGKNAPLTGGSGTSGQGNNGGSGVTYGGGGGGGASAVGSNAPGTNAGGNGGNGTASSITGSSVTYAGGGGGMGWDVGAGYAGSGGSGGGGNGASDKNSAAATAGAPNTGGGGGGGRNSGLTGASGGSGIVIIRYPLALTDDNSTKFEGAGSEKLTLGAPQVDGNTVGMWHMDETSGAGAYIKDATANANHGTPTGTTVVDGFYGKGRSFNGTSDQITGSFPSTSGQSAGTIEAWIYPTNNTDTSQSVFGLWDNPSLGLSVELDFNNGGLANAYFLAGGTWGQASVASSTIPINKWHHMVGTYDGGNVRLYIDGVQVASVAKTGTLGAINSFAIGNYRGSSGAPFYGMIDEVRYSNIARSAEEIAEAYRAGRDHRISRQLSAISLQNSTKLPFYVASDRPGTFLEATVGESPFANYEPDANTVGLWHLEEAAGSGAYLKDSSGNGSNFSIAGGAPTSIQGKIGKARNFNGSSDYLSAPDSSNWFFSTGDFTIDVWASWNDVNKYLMIAQGKTIDGGTPPSAWALDIVSGGVNFFKNNVTQILNAPFSHTANTWYNFAITRAGNTLSAYVNGVFIKSVDITGTTFVDSGDPLTVGVVYCCAGNGTGVPVYFNGIMDELRISKGVARTADEIRQAYEYGRRTHPITIDFVTSPQAAYASGTTVTINNPYGTTALTSTLAVGDTIIFKENVGGTETVSQTTVTSVTNTSTTYGTVVVASAPTFPSGGYSTNAKVFKWQREYMDLTGSLTTQRDAITRLTMRVTDGSQGANVWLDDFRSNTGYITGNTPASFDTATGIGTYTNTGITSTLNRYFQYRAINSSWDTAVAPSLTSVALNYVANSTPGTPTISAPASGATNVAIAPVITLSATDAQSDYMRYKIQIATDNAFTVALQTFDQTVSQTGWSGQNAQTSTAYNSGSTATYTVQANLPYNQLYYIRAYAIDPGGANAWSSPSTTGTFTTTPLPAPTNCQISATVSTGPAIITWTDNLNIEDNYYIESSLNGGAWSAATTLAANTITSSQTVATGTYQYRVRASAGGVYTTYCTTGSVVFPLQSMRFEGVRLEGIQVK